MRRMMLLGAVSLGVVSACPGGEGLSTGSPSGGEGTTGVRLNLAPVEIPSAEQARQRFGIDRDAYVTITNDSFLADPSLVLGKVGLIERRQGGECDQTAEFRFTNERIIGTTDGAGRFTPVPTTPEGKPELRGEILVNNQLAASANFLNFLSAEVGASSVLSVTLTDMVRLRINDSTPVWASARDRWVREHRALFTAPRTCRVVVVMGVVEQQYAYKRYSELQANSTGGVYGVNVEGKLYSSTSDYRSVYRFGLGIEVLETDGAVPSSGDAGVAAQPDAGHGPHADAGPPAHTDAGHGSHTDAGPAAHPDAGPAAHPDAGHVARPDGGATVHERRPQSFEQQIFQGLTRDPGAGGVDQ